jgi:D-alanyl-D-alanine carboxypeptidase (penicillin-binding protein 5/6)
MAARKRPTLYALESGRRRRRSRPRIRPAIALCGLALLTAAVAIGYAAWAVRPLLDTGAGVIPPRKGVVLQPIDGPEAPAPTGKLTGLVTEGARTAPIPGVGVAAGIVVDAATGRVLWMRRAHAPRAIASLTKLMTAHVIARGPLAGTFRVPAAALGLPGETAGLRAGQRVAVTDMLAATLVSSANDAAAALALHRAGSIRGFSRLMNAEARRLGLKDSHYSNPSGIYDQDNRSSAWDVAQLSRAVLRDPRLARLIARKVVVTRGGVDYVNTNKLLWTYSGAAGIKTGFTDAAGHCLAAAATRNGRTLIAVVLGTPGSEFTAAGKALDWGFRHAGR